MISAASLVLDGSVAWKVIQFLETNPDEQLDAGNISAKFDCPRNNVHTLLSGAVQTGALSRYADRDDSEIVYSRAVQPESITDRCLAVYRQSHDIDKVCAVVGVHKLTAFKILKFSGALLAEDRLEIGSISGRVGASAEQEFQRLVPAAKPMNDIVSSNPGFDFDVRGLRVDVKAFGPTKVAGRKSTAPTWQIKLTKHNNGFAHVDLFALFLAAEAGKLLQECSYKTYLVPVDLVQGRSYLNKTAGHPSQLDALEVQPHQLADFFMEGGAA